MEIPVLRMLTLSPRELEPGRSVWPPPALIAARLLVAGHSAVGGGSFPGATLPTTLVQLDAGALGANRLALRLRLADPPVIVRIEDGRLLLDPRTILERQIVEVGAAACRSPWPNFPNNEQGPHRLRR